MTTNKPSTFCNYTLLDELGRGGVSTVYRAIDNRTKKIVALKILNKAMQQNEIARERFRREPGYQFLHPKIVSVIEAGTCNGQMYFTMSLIRGQSLDQMMRGRTVTPRQLYPILRDVAEALDAAHQRAIIHRDIKPSNILVNVEAGTALLTDFGVARTAGATQDRITQTDLSPVGTPTYMSPEQAHGEPHLTPATDIYSLGVVAYHALAGRPPFVGDSALVIANQHASETPRDLRQIARNVPAEVSQVVMHALEKNPTSRYSSAGAFAHAFTEAVLQSQSRVGAGAGASAWQKPAIAGIAVIALVAVVLAFVQARSLVFTSRPAVVTPTIAGQGTLGTPAQTNVGVATASTEPKPTQTPEIPTPTSSVSTQTASKLPASTAPSPLIEVTSVALAETATLAPLPSTMTPRPTAASSGALPTSSLSPVVGTPTVPNNPKTSNTNAISIRIIGIGSQGYYPPTKGCDEREQDKTRPVRLVEINMAVTNSSNTPINGFRAQYTDVNNVSQLTCFRQGGGPLAPGQTISEMKIGTFIDPNTLLRYLVLTTDDGRSKQRICINGANSGAELC